MATILQRALFSQQQGKIGSENAFKILPHIAAVEESGERVVRLNLGEPDFDIPKAIEQEVIDQLQAHNTHYCDPKGVLPLRLAIAKQMAEMRGLKVSPERICVFPGCKPSIGFAQQIYCDPGDEVIYPSPGYPIYESFTKYLGVVPKPLHLKEKEDFTFTGRELEQLISEKTKLIILNFPSNPTGGVATVEQLEEIAEVILRCCGPEVRVYSDEIYEYITYDGQKHVSIASIPGMEARTIISSGMSKSFAWTGGRIGYAVLPTVEEAEAFKALNINYFSCISPYNQAGARVALENESVRKEVIERVSIFEERRNWIYGALSEIKGIDVRKPGGAFYIFPNIREICLELGIIAAYDRLPENLKAMTSPSTLFQMFALYEHRVAMLDRPSFGKIGASDEHYLRISFAADISELKKGVERLKSAAQDREGFARFFDLGKNFF